MKNLCQKEIPLQITWVVHKDDILLALLRGWDDLYLENSLLIDDRVLISFVDELKSKQIIESYEIVKD